MGNLFHQSPGPAANGSHPREEFNRSWSQQLGYAIVERDKILEDMMEVQSNLEKQDLSKTLIKENEIPNFETEPLKSELTYIQELVEKQTSIGNLKHYSEMLKSNFEKVDRIGDRIKSLQASLIEKERKIKRWNDYIAILNATIEKSLQSLHEYNEALSGLLLKVEEEDKKIIGDNIGGKTDENVNLVSSRIKHGAPPYISFRKWRRRLEKR